MVTTAQGKGKYVSSRRRQEERCGVPFRVLLVLLFAIPGKVHGKPAFFLPAREQHFFFAAGWNLTPCLPLFSLLLALSRYSPLLQRTHPFVVLLRLLVEGKCRYTIEVLEYLEPYLFRHCWHQSSPRGAKQKDRCSLLYYFQTGIVPPYVCATYHSPHTRKADTAS